MPGKVIPFSREKPDPVPQSACGRSFSNGAMRLMNGLLNYPMARGPSAAQPDCALAPLASALFQSRLAWERNVGPEYSGDPVWSILLLIYEQQAERGGLEVSSFPDLPMFAPDTVLVRWTMKLISDGVAELAKDTARKGEPVLRLTSEGVSRIERWLQTTKAVLGTVV